jgi:uncharacterized repeat protein (TIGR01451 family)
MTVPHAAPQRLLGLSAVRLILLLTSAADCAWAGGEPLCLPPPLLAPILGPPPVESNLLPAPRLVDGTAESSDPPAPVVILRVRVPASVTAGQELEYRMSVENCSTAAAHHVLVRNPLPAAARFVRASPEPAAREPELLWRLGTLEGGSKQEIVLVLAPTGSEDVKNCARVQFEHGECVTTKVARPGLSMHKNGPTEALLSDTLNYRLTLTNTGSADLINLLVTDILPAGLEHDSGKDRLSWILSTLAPGQSQSVEYQVVAKKVGRLSNKVIAAAAGGLREEMESSVMVGEMKLNLLMTGPERRYINLPATYQMTVSNTGTLPLTNVVIHNPVPAHTTFLDATSAGELLANQVQWVVGKLAPGESRMVGVRLRALAPGRICNQAIASADRGLTRQAEACTDFTGASALALEIGDSEDPIEVGGQTSYTITVRNPGSEPVTHVQIVATVPEEMIVMRAAGASDNRKDGQKIIYDALTLPAGGEARFRIDVKAQRPGDVRFKVELTADQLTSGPVQQEESTTIFAMLPSSRHKGQAEMIQALLRALRRHPLDRRSQAKEPAVQ